jgi:WD40 repeat protein
MSLSPNGATLATPGSYSKVALWEAGSLRKTRELAGHDRSLQSVAFSHDGRRIASASQDKLVTVWDVGRARAVATCRGHVETVQCVAFAPDDRTLASCGNDGTVRLWDTATGDLLRTYRAEKEGGGRQWCIAFSRDGRTLISCGVDGLIRRWDVAVPQDRLVIRLPSLDLYSLAIPAGSDRLLLSTRGFGDDTSPASISTWDLTRGVLLATRQIDASRRIREVVLSRDGKSFSTLEHDGRLTLWDTETGRPVRQGPVISVPEGRAVAGLSMCDGLVAVMDTVDGYRHGRAFWDPVSNRLFHRPFEFVPLARAPESESFIVWVGPNLVRWDLATDEVTPLEVTRAGVVCLARYSSAGRLVAGQFDDLTVGLGDAASLKWQSPLHGHASPIADLDFSPDDKVLASGSDDGDVRLWDVASNQLLLTLSTVSDRRSDRLHLRFSPDGSYLACGLAHNKTQKSQVTIWLVARPEYPVP